MAACFVGSHQFGQLFERTVLGGGNSPRALAQHLRYLMMTFTLYKAQDQDRLVFVAQLAERRPQRLKFFPLLKIHFK
jgi:hypothetical protein